MFSGGFPFYRFKKQHIQDGYSLTFWWEIVLEGPLVWYTPTLIGSLRSLGS